MLAALVPLATSNDYIIRVAGNVCLFGLLALGLNVVVGYAGLLDLGYVAFYGIGGYGYAMLSSSQFGLHLPVWVSIPLVVIVAALFGLLLGLPSLRLTGDYLAIVSLGFGQIFVLLANSMDKLNVPWSEEPLDLTGGPNGITDLDPIQLFGLRLTSVTHYFYLLLAVLALIWLVLHHINSSRVGRAWRAMREDTLAAEAMGIPVKRLKLLAFAIGAAVAGLSGSIYTAWQTAVFPSNFDVTLLITLYAMVVLGGAGSQIGAITGALLLSVIPELLRGPDTARLLFYGGIVALTLLLTRPRWRGAALLAAVLGLRAAGEAGARRADTGPARHARGTGGGWPGRAGAALAGLPPEPDAGGQYRVCGGGGPAHGRQPCACAAPTLWPAAADAVSAGLRLGDAPGRRAERDAAAVLRGHPGAADDLPPARPVRQAARRSRVNARFEL